MLAVVSMTFLPFSGAIAAGDGAAHVRLPTGEMALMSEGAQLGIITYWHGDEKLAISIRVAESDLLAGDSAVWIFPVPAPPDDVDISLISSLRPFSGLSLGALAERELSSRLALAMMSQVYTIPFSLAMAETGMSPARLMLPTVSDSDDSSLLIFESVASEGVVAELVSTEDEESLAIYLASKGMEIGESEQEIVDEYVGLDYSFVVSWIEDTQYFIDNAGGRWYDGEVYYSLGVLMDFPTERIYYPMRLTSAYGEEHVPMLIEILGYVSPEDPKGYDIDIRYMVNGDVYLPGEMVPSSSSETVHLEYRGYTRIWVDVESSYLESDIWMAPEQPLGVDALEYTVEHPFTVMMVIFTASSILAGIVAALIAFRSHRPRLERFALLSCLNFLSVLAIWLAIRNEKVQRALVRSPKEPEPGPSKEDYRGFVIAYSITFVVMIILIPAVFLLAASH